MVGAIVLAAALAGAGWLAGRGIKSPAQIAAEAEPPPASLITVDVVSTVLTAEVITRADVGYADPVTLSLSGGLGNPTLALVVTAAPKRGDDLAEGSAAIEVAGRPVFLLAGPAPVFRDLRPGSSGPDVEQLETALARLGHFSGEPDQSWDDATGAAVSSLYAEAGYKANGVSEAEKSSLQSARDRLAGARRSLRSAEEALADARKGPTELSVRLARTELAAAQSGLELAKRNAEEAAGGIEKARTDAADGAEKARAAADDALRAAELARNRAAENYASARMRLDSARAGVSPTTGKVPTAAEHEQLRQAFETAERTLNEAEEALADAQSEAAKPLPSGEKEVQAASDAATAAQQAVRSAEDRLASAQQKLDDLLKAPDVTRQSEAVDSARSELDVAAELLAQLEATTGVWLPAGEVIILKSLPVRVDRIFAEQGRTVSGGFITVTGSDLAARGSVSQRDLPLVKEGNAAFIDDPSLSEPVEGTIRLVDSRAGTRNVASDRHYIEIDVEGIPDDLVGSNVKIVIPVGDTGEPVLAVPAAALSAASDESARVEVAQADGTSRFARVTPGLSASGLVQITPAPGEQLEAGDRVVVGTVDGTAASSGASRSSGSSDSSDTSDDTSGDSGSSESSGSSDTTSTGSSDTSSTGSSGTSGSSGASTSGSADASGTSGASISGSSGSSGASISGSSGASISGASISGASDSSGS